MADFQTWLTSIEVKLGKVEKCETTAKLQDVLEEVRAKDSAFQTLTTHSKENDVDDEQSRKHEQELKRRWTKLQNTLLNLASANTKKEKGFENEVELLREFLEEKLKWLKIADIGKCLTDIEKQIEEHDKLRLVM